jgi:hypothetical protein
MTARLIAWFFLCKYNYAKTNVSFIQQVEILANTVGSRGQNFPLFMYQFAEATLKPKITSLSAEMCNSTAQYKKCLVQGLLEIMVEPLNSSFSFPIKFSEIDVLIQK